MKPHIVSEARGRVLPYKGLIGTCGQPGYVFQDFCLKQGIEFIIFSAECTIGMVWGLTALKHYGNKALWDYDNKV